MKVSPIEAVRRASVAAACAVAACALLAAPGSAGPHPVPHAAPARKHAARAPRHASRAQGMRAIVDPATGRLVATPRVSDAPGAPAPAGSAAPVAPAGAAATPQVRTLADGTQIVAVPADQMQYEVVRVGKDGKLVRACVHGDPARPSFPAQREER